MEARAILALKTATLKSAVHPARFSVSVLTVEERLGCALALTAFEFIDAILVPIDELVQVGIVKGHWK